MKKGTPPKEKPLEVLKTTGLTATELGQCFNMAKQTISDLKKAGMPHVGARFDLPACIQWRISHATRNAAPGGSAPQDDGDLWLTRFRKERARMARLERLARTGELVPLAQVDASFTERAYEIARGIQQMGRRIGHKLAEKSQKTLQDVVRVVDAEARRLCEEFSRPIQIEEPKP